MLQIIPCYFYVLTYLPDFTCTMLKSLLELVRDRHIEERVTFPICEGDRCGEHDVIWEIIVAYWKSRGLSHSNKI